MTHPKWQGLRTFHFHAPRACVIERLLIDGRILFKFAVNILQITTSTFHLHVLRARVPARVCERASGKKFTYI
jgi:hypothetical protein